MYSRYTLRLFSLQDLKEKNLKEQSRKKHHICRLKVFLLHCAQYSVFAVCKGMRFFSLYHTEH